MTVIAHIVGWSVTKRPLLSQEREAPKPEGFRIDPKSYGAREILLDHPEACESDYAACGLMSLFPGDF